MLRFELAHRDRESGGEELQGSKAIHLSLSESLLWPLRV